MANSDQHGAGEGADSGGDGTLGRIALKRVRVSRAEVEARGGAVEEPVRPATNPMNKLVPYLDLFSRLEDEELSRLARVPSSVVAQLRQQVTEVNRALERYHDLLPRLGDAEFVRLTGANPKTIRFWRLSQPSSGSVAKATDAGAAVGRTVAGGSAVAPATGASPGVSPPAEAVATSTASSAPRPAHAGAASLRTSQPAPAVASSAPQRGAATIGAGTPQQIAAADSGAQRRGALDRAAATASIAPTAISSQDSASMLMDEVKGEPFPGFESTLAPRGRAPVMEDIEVGMFEDDEDEPLDADISLADDEGFF